MKNLEEIKEAICGKKIIKLYRTPVPERTMWHGEGLGELKWYKLIIEIEDGSKYLLGDTEIEKWNNKKLLFELKAEHSDKLETAKILDLISDEDYNGIHIKLDNDCIMYHDTFFGSVFAIEKENDLFDESGQLI